MLFRSHRRNRTGTGTPATAATYGTALRTVGDGRTRLPGLDVGKYFTPANGCMLVMPGMEHGAGMGNILIDERKIARVVLADIASARQALDEHKACDDDAQKEHDGQSRLVFPLASETTKKRWKKKAGEGRDLRRVRVPIVNERHASEFFQTCWPYSLKATLAEARSLLVIAYYDK